MNGMRQTMASLAKVAAQAPNTYELVRWFGAQRRRTRMARLAKGAGWFGAGAIVGTGLVALLTPHSGREMRRRLGDQAKRASEYVMSQTNSEDRP